jgi:K+-transporting ATPase KdpF subunit
MCHEYWFLRADHCHRPGALSGATRHVQGVQGKQMTLLDVVAGCMALLLLIYLFAALLKPEWFE